MERATHGTDTADATNARSATSAGDLTGASATAEGLVIEGITKTYGDLVALDDLSLTVRPGELFGFVGSNGAGKTTTMRIVLGVLAADAGSVHLHGREIDLDLRRRIGYMPAERGLYPKMKVGEQLLYFARLHGLDKTAAQESVDRWTERLGVAHRVTDAVEDLSTGNQQRVQLAAALVHEPDLLVLDEPFSGLDPLAVDVMSEVLREKCASGVPVIFSSHQLELVEQLCDRVGIIAHGRLRALGTVPDLRRAGGVRVIEVHTTAPAGWADEVPGVREVTHLDGRTRVQLDVDADDQALLAAALRQGAVTVFSPHDPPLSDLYREVVSA